MFLSCQVRVSEWYIRYSYLNVKELLAQNRRDIWSLSDWNGTWNHNYLVGKQTLYHFAKRVKWLSCVVSTYICAVHLTVRSYHVTYSFVSEWLNGWVFLYKLSDCGFNPRCSHIQEQLRWHPSGAFIVNFKSHLFVGLLLLIWNRYMFAG